MLIRKQLPTAQSIRSMVAAIAARAADRAVVIVGPHASDDFAGPGRVVLFASRTDAGTAGWLGIAKNTNATIGQLEAALRGQFAVVRFHSTNIAALEDAARTWPASNRIATMLAHERGLAPVEA